MHTTYRHTQLNLATSAILALSAILAASMLWGSLDPGSLAPPPSPETQVCIGMYLVAVVLAWLAAYRLTVEVSTHSVQWRLGAGLLRASYPLAEVESATVVAAPFSLLPRIRRTGSCQFVSVAPGRRGVELALTAGRRVVLGTNDAQALVEAIASVKAH